MTQNGGCAARWTAWEGVEVEGRLIGLPTLFVGRLANAVDVLRALPRLTADRPHVYLNPETIEDGGWAFAREVVRIAQLVTLAVRPEQYAEMPDDLFGICHVVLIVPLARRPKDGDEVRLDLAPYHVLLATTDLFLETTPDAYVGDRGVLPRGGG